MRRGGLTSGRVAASGPALSVMGKGQPDVLEDAAGNGDADGYEDQAAQEFAPLASRGAEPITKLQPDQGQRDPHRADGDRGNGRG